MVSGSKFKKLISDKAGVVLVEAMISMPIVILVLVAMVEFGTAVFQWNQSVKALQVGARLAAVSSPIVTDADYLTLESDLAGLLEGDPVPNGVRSVSCGAGAATCNTANFDRLYFGSDGRCGSPGTSVPGMCDVAPLLSSDVIKITYRRSGLGYVGRPFGPVTTITVELHDASFNFLLFGKLIPGLNSLKIPSNPVSITSEDVSTCGSGC